MEDVGDNMKITLKLKEPQHIKYTDIVTIERIGKTGQKKTVKKQFDGITLQSGDNAVVDKVYHQIEKSPWFMLLVDRKDIIVHGETDKKVKTPKVTKKTTKTVGTKVG